MKLYLVVAGVYFASLLFSKFSDRECSKTNFASWLLVILASAFWILVIPISLIEMKFKDRAKVPLEETEKSISYTVSSQLELVEVEEVDSNNIRLTPENT